VTPRRGPTPEALATRAITDYLRVAQLGKVKRINVGQVRMGEAPTHPWAKDNRRIVRFGETGHSDFQVELSTTHPGIPLTLRGRDLFLEIKAAGWTAPKVPKVGCAPSTLKAYRHHVDQETFLARQRDRGNLGFFARSPFEVYLRLVESGFKGLPVPSQGIQEAPKPPQASAGTPRTPQTRPGGSQ